MPFQPGNNMNPGGRPRKSDEQKRYEFEARQFMADIGLSEVKKMAMNGGKAEKQWALDHLAAYGFGRPTMNVESHIEHSVSDADIDAELSKLIERARRTAEALAASGVETGAGTDGAQTVATGK